MYHNNGYINSLFCCDREGLNGVEYLHENLWN